MPEITRRDFMKYSGIVAGGVLLGGIGCLDEEIMRSGQSTNPENYSFGEVSRKVLASGFKSPLGLNELTLNLPPPPPETIENKVLLGEAIFMDRPSGNNNSFSKKPSVWRYSSFEEDNPLSRLYEFPDSDFSEFSVDPAFTGCIEIPRRGIAVYSDVSNKLFLLAEDRGRWIRIGPLMQSDELLGTTDIAGGSDGLLYAAQSGIRSTEEPIPGSQIRPPRVISINPFYKTTQEKFLLRPSDDPNFENNQGQHVKRIEKGIYAGNFLETGEKYSVVENSPSGIIDTGIYLFGSSSLDNMVLAYDGNNVSLVSTDPGFLPASMQVSGRGDLVIGNPSGIDYILSDRILSGQPTRQSLYSFTGNLGNSEEVPVGSDIKMLLKENSNKIGLYLTNTNSGKLESLEVQKVR